MKVDILAFGIVKEIFGNVSATVDMESEPTVEHLKMALEIKYPALQKLGSYMIAVNNEYAEGKTSIASKDEIAVIPPVSGG
jgi:molybdopterin converting factor subunit 1